MRKFFLFLFILFMLIGNVEAATYYLRNDGTAANKAAATGPCTTVSACMNETVHNGETFAGNDIIKICPQGGVFNLTIDTPSNGGSGTPITYDGVYDTSYGWPVFDEGFKLDTNYIVLRGVEIRPGAVESATKTFEGGRFANAARSWQASEETAVTGWYKGNTGIFAVGIGITGGATSVTPQLYWRDKTDSGTFAAVGATGEVKYTAVSGLTDNDNVTSGEAGVSSGKSYETCLQCEQEDSYQASTSTSLDANEWTELQVGISFADGNDGHEYEFALFESATQIGGTSTSIITLDTSPYNDEFADNSTTTETFWSFNGCYPGNQPSGCTANATQNETSGQRNLTIGGNQRVGDGIIRAGYLYQAVTGAFDVYTLCEGAVNSNYEACGILFVDTTTFDIWAIDHVYDGADKTESKCVDDSVPTTWADQDSTSTASIYLRLARDGSGNFTFYYAQSDPSIAGWTALQCNASFDSSNNGMLGIYVEDLNSGLATYDFEYFRKCNATCQAW